VSVDRLTGSARRHGSVITPVIHDPEITKRHDVQVIVTGRPGPAPESPHSGYVAGRYRDGSLSDTWTDVARCASRTFVAYVPACTCGWTGSLHPATVTGFSECQRALRHEHFRALSALGRVTGGRRSRGRGPIPVAAV
jgi:hypothetical protein